MSTVYDFCVVGGGPSGLTAAYQLLKAGASVLLLERDDRTGGLAKSYDYAGNIFDTGPKRFHTDDKRVLDFLEEIEHGGMLTIPRSTKVHFLRRYLDWPLKSADILRLPMGVAIRSALELVQKREIQDPASFHEYIRSKYGETLYQVFFRPYTEKFLRWDAEDVHSDWATTGINRTVVDSRVRASTLFDILKSLLLPGKIDTKFLYPSRGGFGGFWTRLLEICSRSENFHLRCADSIVSLRDDGGRIEAVTRSGLAFACGQMIWSGNLNDLLGLIGAGRDLHYLNTVFFNVVCRESGLNRQRAQWIYVSEGDSLVSRITCMREFAPYTCPDGNYNFICEVTDSQARPQYFGDPRRFTDKVLCELREMAFLKRLAAVEAVHINCIRDTYPIYHRDYLLQFQMAKSDVKRYSRRIHLLGRSGAFWYNNSDHSIRFAVDLVRMLLGQCADEFDFRQYFGGSVGKVAGPQPKS